MAKLYWRVKRGNENEGYRWVWEPAEILIFNKFSEIVQVKLPEESQ